MFRTHKLGGGLLVVLLCGATLTGPSGPAWAGPASAGHVSAGPASAGHRSAGAGGPGGDSGRAALPRTVTLLTGDRLTVTPGGVAVTRGPGRRGVTFASYRARDHLHVLPSDAFALLNAGRLDPRLFDVTGLLTSGYDDRRDNLPLILTGRGGAAGRVAGAAAAPGTDARELSVIDGAAVRVEKNRLGALWQALTGGSGTARSLAGGVATVWLDGMRTTSLDVSVPQIGAPAAWREGYDGTGVTVAVLDTGIDVSHPDLAGRVADTRTFAEGEDALDRVGHGTHVASTIAGSGVASRGRYRGAAPGARLLNGKVCVEEGCPESAILAGMQWAAERGATVVNLSLGGWDAPGLDPLEQAIGALTARYDTLFVAAAGNNGGDGTVSSPASADAALAVGAVDKSDELAFFSSRGPRSHDAAVKPEITAPGVDIVAARSKDGFLGEPGQSYTALSGTSMATPHVVASAAILAQRHPDWTAGDLKAALMGSARAHPRLGAFAQGAGRVDVGRAIHQTVWTVGGSISFGRELWPHPDDTPDTRTVTYRNSGTAPVTLHLDARGTRPDGTAAPAGAFRLSADTLTVPARGTASVQLTSDTRVPGPDGYYAGRLVATADGLEVGTPFAVDREVESYDVALRYLDRTGAQTGEFASLLVRTDGPTDLREVIDPDGAVTARVPKGRYVMLTFVRTPTPDPAVSTVSLLVTGQLAVTGPMALTADARRAGAIAVGVPRADARTLIGDVGGELALGDGGLIFSLAGDDFSTIFSGQVGPAGPVPGLISRIGGTLARVRPDGSADDTPYLYQLAWFRRGTMFDGLRRQVRSGQLATVHARFARQATGGVQAWMYSFATLPGMGGGGWVVLLPTNLPGRRIDYYNDEPGVQWDSEFVEWREVPDDFPDILTSTQAPPTRYRAGTAYREQWNQGVFGPTLAGPRWPDLWVSRTADTLVVAPPLFGDGQGRPGGSALETATGALYRDGVKIAGDELLYQGITVPAQRSRYRAELTMTRGAPAVLSTRVALAFTFTSAHVAGERPRRLPVSVVHFAPRLDQVNAARAGQPAAVGVTIERQPGTGYGTCRELTVEVSYDDGRSWQRVRMVGDGDRRVALLHHPDAAGFVSLRATAVDGAGNGVEQTVLRAYRLAR